jgi:hypothetical protein
MARPPYTTLWWQNITSTWATGYNCRDTILAKKSRQMDRVIKEAKDIEIHPDNMNRKDGFSLSQTWKPLNHDLTKWRQSLIKESTPSHGP